MKHLACLCLLLLSVVPAFSKSHHLRRSPNASAGAFDSYLLALSWSPEFCHGHPADPQCTGGKHFGFVVHGLWPEYKGGGGPENCGTQPGLADPSKMLDIMPTLKLIDHEWKTHGTCSGLSADDYFALIRKAYNSVKLPAKFAATEAPLQIKKDVEGLNSGLIDNEIMINCTSNYLQEVEICFTKALTPMACTAPKDCRAQSVHIPPVQ